jgi:hypothetical protein
MNRSEDRTTNQARLIPTRRRRHNGDDNTVKPLGKTRRRPKLRCGVEKQTIASIQHDEI